MKFIFPSIKLEGRDYSSVIMGDDNFTGWWTKGKFDSEKKTSNCFHSRTKYEGFSEYSINFSESIALIFQRV